MSKMDRQTPIFSSQSILTVILILVIILYLFPRALNIFRRASYKTKLNNFIQTVNTGIDNKYALVGETFIDMYSYTPAGLGQSMLTPVSYIFGKNSCEEQIDSQRFKMPILASTCVDGSIISTYNICILRAQPRYKIKNKEYYMFYIDLDCKSGNFNRNMYTGSNFVDIDNYAKDLKYDDVYPLIFTLKDGNFYVSLFSDQSDERYEKSRQLFECNKNLFFDSTCKR